MKKRYLLLIILLVISLSLFGCKKNKEVEESAVIQDNITEDNTIKQEEAVKEAAAIKYHLATLDELKN